MTGLKTIVCFSFLLLFTGLSSNAQFIGYRIDDGKDKTSFKFELINNLVVIPVVLNDSFPMYFILDTGVRTTLLTNDNSDKLDVTFNRIVKIGALGSNSDIDAYAVSNVTLNLPGITGKGQTLIVLGEDYLNLEGHIGKEVHGILGYDFFQHFIVQIQYDKKIISVFNKDSFEIGKKFEAFPITIESGRPYINASITQNNGSKVKGRFLLDSGASHSLLIEPDNDSSIIVPEKTLKTIIGWGLGGEVSGDLGRIKSLDIGSFSFSKVLGSYAPKLRTATVEGQKARLGSIGGEILSRFTCIYNYSANTIYLKKNHQYKRSFEYNLSGLDLVASGKNFKLFTVIYVVKDSPADICGIQIGDNIVAINGKGAGDLSLDEINGMFRSNAGLQINAIILRNGLFQSHKFRLKRII